MGTPHIAAEPGDIAETVLLPGDPLRAKWVAETYLEDAVQYNAVRNMFGYTGTYNGKPVSIQGTGMGMPSLAIYVHELLNEFGAKTLVRIGSCGALRNEVKVRDLILATASSTDSGANRAIFGDIDYAAAADFSLTRALADKADELAISYHAGPIVSGDQFYRPEDSFLDLLTRHGALGVEMEAALLFRLAAGMGARAAAVLSVSDHLITGEDLPPEERERGFGDMVRLVLETVTG